MVIKRTLNAILFLLAVYLGYLGPAFSRAPESNKGSNVMLTLRKADERGLSQHSWLTSRHTFSFADYYDRKQMGFGALRVINEDKIQGGRGFDSHSHQNMEIISYVIKGSLQHKDSMGNESIIKPNELQRMSAGSGVTHSEYNHEKNSETHLYQIWIKPKHRDLKSSYAQKSFEKELENNPLVLVASNTGREGSLSIDQDVDLYLSRLKKGHSLEFKPQSQRSVWVQVIKGKLKINNVEVVAGDGLSSKGITLHFYPEQDSEFMLFDLN